MSRTFAPSDVFAQLHVWKIKLKFSFEGTVCWSSLEIALLFNSSYNVRTLIKTKETAKAKKQILVLSNLRLMSVNFSSIPKWPMS